MTMLEPVETDAPEIFEGDLDDVDFQARSSAVGFEYKQLAREFLIGLGARFVRDHHTIGSYAVEGVVRGANEQQFVVLAHGVLDDTPQAGLRRTDTVKKAGFDAIQLRRLRQLPVLLVTSHLPEPGSSAAHQLADLAPDIFDVVATTGDLAGRRRLEHYLHDDDVEQLPAPWRDTPSTWEPELFDSDDVPIPVTIRFGAQADDVADTEEAF